MTTIAELRQRIGEELGVSGWIPVDQSRIDAFADVTGDRQFIHVDPGRAAATALGGTVAHGLLTLSLLATMAESLPGGRVDDAEMTINYGFDRVRFLSPVPAGSRIRGRFVLLSLDEKRPGRWQRTSAVTVEIADHATPALVARWITQLIVR